MRLLNVESLEIREFYPDNIPSYVVASHRWVRGEGEEREATFQDVKERQNINTTGYRKILDFAGYVRAHVPSIKWLWIDTCCINKQDAQEVTEAINLMFKWYRNSVVCLAYLADVKTGDITDSFMESEWFKRGWTLQELLAPQMVIFLSHDWHVIGHKRSDAYREDEIPLHPGVTLNARITHITRIPETVLGDFQHSRVLTLDDRLAWMDGRETTREEDMSYCLFGIFEAPIGANYGEGEGRARKRLLAELNKDNAVLDKLPVASGAAFDDRENELVSECLQGTRVDVLRDIDAWASHTNGACIFWLGGKAGTGKSTIFRTVARSFRDQDRLAGSFCFKRGEADRGHASRLITTISAQLARRLPDVRQQLIVALEKDPDIVRKSLKEQFQKLILHPLEHFGSPPLYGPAWVIGIDALDECDNESDIGIVVDLLARLKELKLANFRIFLTSRPDLPLRLGFGRMSDNTYVDIRLEEVSEHVIAHDIAIYLRHELAEIRSDHAKPNRITALTEDWPGEDVVEALIQMAQPLFIFAATVCRLLGEPDEDPNESLRMVLDRRLEASQLDRTYYPILDRLLHNKTGRQQERIVDEFRVVVGAIIILAEPLPVPALSRLLGVSDEKVLTRLHRLHSVLDVPSMDKRYRPVRPLHLSFRDYLTDRDSLQKTRFWIDKAEKHRTLADQCLRLLCQSRMLKQDLCSVGKPGIRRVEISSQRIKKSISADMAYACRHWVWHLVEGGEQLRDNGQVHQFLQSHFLHWLEALSWLGRLSAAIDYISNLQFLVEATQGLGLLAFLNDTRRFVLRNRHIIDLTPLQTYCSALVFAPTQSIVRKHFEGNIPQWLYLQPQVVSKWNAETQKLEGHDDGVTAVAFSPDGQTVASGSWDKTVRLWNARTGEETQKLEGHDDAVTAVAFSPDGQTVASGSWDRTVRLWNARTGEETQKLEGHDDGVTAVAFSPDGQTVASGSWDRTVRLWNARTGEETQKLEGHDDAVTAVAFSPDGQTVASGSWDRTVRLWNARTGEETQKLEGHDDGVTAVAFSPDGQTVASGSWDRTVRLWNARTGEETQKLEGHDDAVTAVAFSPDGQTVASGSRDRTVRLWNARTGEETQKLEGHDDEVTAVAFSPDGQTVASGSWDRTVRLWNARIGEETQKLEGHDDGVTAVAFSPDGQTVASGSIDRTVRLWNARTGEETQKLEGHDDAVTAVAFSPDGQTVASGSWDRTVRLWNARTGEETQKLEGHDDGVTAVAFSPDGQTVASGSWDRTVRLWNARIGEETQKLEGHDDAVTAVAFSPDGQTVASGSRDRTVRLWNARTGEETQKLEGYDDRVTAVAFSPDGQTVASGSRDRTVRLWNARTGHEIHQFQKVGYINWLAFDEHGTSLSTSTRTFNVRPYSPSLQPTRRLLPTSLVALRDQWVGCEDQDLLWLPHEYRVVTSAVYGDTLVIGQASGAVSFFRIKMD